jgi:hypothetical protein
LEVGSWKLEVGSWKLEVGVGSCGKAAYLVLSNKLKEEH